jgi:hypothetical protein
MKKLVLFAIAFGSVVAACAPPTTINITPGTGGHGGEGGGNGGQGGDGGNGGQGGGTTTTPTKAPNAHDMYVQQVHPSLIKTCGGCHNPMGKAGAPVYLDYDAEVSYPLTKAYKGIVQDPADKSILVTKGAHQGPVLTPDQVTLVENWVQMELDANPGGGGAGGAGGAGGGTTSTSTTSAQTLESMLNSFAACMDFDLWKSSGMDKFPLQQTNGEGPCMSCHNTGTGGTWLSGDPQDTFDNNKTFPYIMRLVKPVYDNGVPTDLAPSDRFFNKGNEPCQNPPICHPKFDLTPQNKQALETFVGNTLTKWKSGVCGKM